MTPTYCSLYKHASYPTRNVKGGHPVILQDYLQSSQLSMIMTSSKRNVHLFKSNEIPLSKRRDTSKKSSNTEWYKNHPSRKIKFENEVSFLTDNIAHVLTHYFWLERNIVEWKLKLPSSLCRAIYLQINGLEWSSEIYIELWAIHVIEILNLFNLEGYNLPTLMSTSKRLNKCFNRHRACRIGLCFQIKSYLYLWTRALSIKINHHRWLPAVSYSIWKHRLSLLAFNNFPRMISDCTLGCEHGRR